MVSLFRLYLYYKQGRTMDVSRIEAYNPNKINWRNLTAREILKYQNLGVEVPNQYLQWAQNFVNSVDSFRNDEVTYEKAVSSSGGADTADNDNENKSGQGITEAQAGQNLSQNNTEEPADDSSNVSGVKSRRAIISNSGGNLRAQAKSFTKDSNSGAKDASVSAILSKLLESDSEDEIQALENDMKTLLAQAEEMQAEFKIELDKLNGGKADKSTFERIKELQQELESFGNQGQSVTSSSQSSFNDINSELKDQESIIDDAADYGEEAISIGSNLINQATNEDGDIAKIDIDIGNKAKIAGKNAKSISSEAMTLKNSTASVNTSNSSKIPDYLKDTLDKTSVDGTGEEDAINEADSVKNDPATGKRNEKDKSIKSSSNEGKDESDKININIDEILKRKVRKGLEAAQ